MRLTDLVRDRNSEKKPQVKPAPLPQVEQDDFGPVVNAPKKPHVSGHLPAGDLDGIYDLSRSRDLDKRRDAALPDISSFEESPQIVQEAPEFPPAVEVREQAPPDLNYGYITTRPAPPSKTSAPDGFENRDEQELADTLHIELLTHLDDIYEEGRSGEEIYVERIIQPLLQTIALSKTSNALLRKAVKLKKGQRSFTTHSLNVAILAIKIGLSRGYTDERVFSIALCALLGDIGMTRVDPAILNKAGKLTPEEFMEIKRHIDYSVEIVSDISNKFPFLGPIIYQIHERENGSGYPQGLKGANIHEFAKIIGMCDVNIALTEPKANREHYSGYVAMQQIISRRGIDFDAKIIKSLIDVLSVFPLESLVRLNNGAIGRVIDISPVHPTRPILTILINSDGEKLQRPTILNLEKEPLLYIENPDIEEGVVL